MLHIPLKLIGNRNDDGKLYLNVNKVNPDNVWNVGDGNEVGFLSRNTLYEKYKTRMSILVLFLIRLLASTRQAFY